MIKGTNFIGSTPSKEGTAQLFAHNPANGEAFPESFSVATTSEIDEAVTKATQAFQSYKSIAPTKKADFLEAIADEIMALGDPLIARACGESGLPEGRIQGERGRTCNQLKMFANLVREGSWVNATIDTAIPDRAPAPKPDLRKMEVAIGPVAIFGASNFPLAFSTAGGDTASALAAGNPVIVKGHESHLGTNEMVSQAILKAAQKTGMPEGVFSMVNGGIPVGQQLVKHPQIKAVGFTGSFRGGKALFDLANRRDEPIPVYAEMGSINPTFIFPNKLKENPADLGKMVAGSVSMGVGQFCTNPGLLVGIQSPELEAFSAALSQALMETTPSTMLNKGIAESYYANRKALLEQKGVTLNGNATETEGNRGQGLTATVPASEFLKNTKLHEEIFGPFTLLVICENESEMKKVAESLQGQLTGTLLATESDMTQNTETVDALAQKVGRILFNGMPTGVEVCPAMHHGGPFPASTNGKYTSVGTDAIYRFTRSICFQNWPDQMLPTELKAENPMGIWRKVDNELRR
ncbi:aldehyde dehydrogenase (NADP(+)) [Roseivirga seohaensis]|uniref:aldehyde dehydrogenase (NADP(+)) n=1 Tax=Roseivirga seohaensis TaxID=1914963 RepID=UPI003BAAB015